LRERQVLRLVLCALPHKEIADRLSIAAATETRHVANMLLVVGVSTRLELCRWALSHPGVLDGRPVPRAAHPDGCECAAPYCAYMRQIPA
jgi:DNA-binding CsgD family transcriptional regulator